MYRFACSNTFIYLKYYRCLLFVQYKVVIFINFITKRNRASVVFALCCSLEHSASDLFRQLCAEPLVDGFQHTFSDNAGAVGCNVLLGGNDSNTIVGKYLLVVTGVVLVTRKAIQLIHEYYFKASKLTVSNHVEKLRPPVCLRALCPVNIFMYDKKIVCSRIALTLVYLSLNGYFVLFI